MSPASVVEPLSPAKIDMEVLTEDDLALARLGHKQQLRRRFNIWSMLALSLCLLATWEALSTTLIAALLSGGPVSVIYGFLLAWAGTLAQAASLAEISSIYPTAGGQYHWTACLAPPGGKKWLSYVVGWASCGGLIATTASAPFACALQIQGLIGLCNPDYESKTWVVVVSFWGVLLLAGSVNIFGIKLLPAFNYLSCNSPSLFCLWTMHMVYKAIVLMVVTIHIVGFLALFISLLAVAPKNSATAVWATFENNSGWPNDGVAWLLGMLTSCYVFIGYDCAAHMRSILPTPPATSHISLS